jgi:two-component system, NarL family, sensor kinase
VVPLAAGVATALLAVATLALAVANHTGPADWLAGNQANQWLGGLAFGVTGALVLGAQPWNRLGPLLAGCGVTALVSALGVQYATYALAQHPVLPAVGPAAWVGSVLWLPAFLGVLVGLPLLFPDGRLPSRRWRYAAWLAAGAGTLTVLGFATTQYALDQGDFPGIDNPLDLPFADEPQIGVTAVGFLVCGLVAAAATVSLVVRMRRAAPPERSRNAWLVTFLVLAAAAAYVPGPDWVSFLVDVAAFAALAVGIVRHGLFDIELVLSRTVVYATLTLLALGVYFVAAAALGSGSEVGVVPALLTAVAALLLAGGRTRLQRIVDRVMYGERDPGNALAALGERLGSALGPDEVLPATVESVRTTFNLPYAEVWLTGEPDPAYSSGQRPESIVQFPLAHAGEDVGVLVVGLRRGERALSATDAAVLSSFARQAAVAAHGVRATRELRRSRERIVLAREEERHRIRRDLHDGLGPALAGISLGLETAGRAAETGSPRAALLLEDLRVDAANCVDDVRRIVADLRPPALDGADLATALRRHAEQVSTRSGGTFAVRPGELFAEATLPAAVEVAAYRIATEAITNAARHSGGTGCRISCVHDPVKGLLHLEVEDDGSGAPPVRHGTGLGSMRERAEELGGSCVVVFRPGSGTTVVADLPCAAAVVP